MRWPSQTLCKCSFNTNLVVYSHYAQNEIALMTRIIDSDDYAASGVVEALWDLFGGETNASASD